MTFEGLLVLLIIVLMLVALAREMMRPGLILFTALIIFMATGIITPEEAIAGFSNKGMITVGILFLVSEGVRQSGALNILASTVLPRKNRKPWLHHFQILAPISTLSAFLNNTPVVIIFAPMVKKWAEKMGLSASKYLIPISYATILGGICTLIGTSTNLVVHGLMLDNGLKGLSMFELGKIGVPFVIVGILYIAFIGHRLLPGDSGQRRQRPRTDQRLYYFDVVIPTTSKFVGAVVKNRKLSSLSDLYVYTLKRNGEAVSCKNLSFALQAGDRLVVASKSNKIEYLTGHPDLQLEALSNIGPDFEKKKLIQSEAIIAPRFQGIGSTLNEFDFYGHYQGAVVGLNRNGIKIFSDFGGIILREGDNLIVLSTDAFIKNWSESKAFYLINPQGELEEPESRPRMWISLALLAVMILGATFGEQLPTIRGTRLDMFYFAAVVTLVMAWGGLFNAQKYTKSISWDVLITIACAFGISKALQNSGTAELIATTAIGASAGMGPVGVLIAIYLITTIFTEIITNNAAAAIVFPIALSAAEYLHVDPHPFFITICVAASASFATPIGYQTNMIVQSMGDYKFLDFTKVGLFLNLTGLLLSILLIPIFWEF